MSAIKKAVAIVGSQSEMARRLKVTPQAVQQWVAIGRPPVMRVLEIERATNGRVTRHELRPDVFGQARRV